jgi:hypothetical protein
LRAVAAPQRRGSQPREFVERLAVDPLAASATEATVLSIMSAWLDAPARGCRRRFAQAA